MKEAGKVNISLQAVVFGLGHAGDKRRGDTYLMLSFRYFTFPSVEQYSILSRAKYEFGCTSYANIERLYTFTFL